MSGGFSQHPSVLLLGGPGTGKGTQGAALGSLPNLVHLAMGDIFRALDRESALGREFLSYSTRGLLVPDEFTVRLFLEHLAGLSQTGRIRPNDSILLLDGIPRTVRQVELLRDRIRPLTIVYLVMEDREKLVKRLQGRARQAGRPDDADEAVIRKRLDVYDQETAPVIRAYDAKLVQRVNADRSPLAVLADIATHLDRVISSAV